MFIYHKNMYICIYTCVCIYVYIYTHIYVPQICFPFPFFSALLHKNLFCTIMPDYGLIIKAIVLTLQWNYTTGLRCVKLVVYLDFNKARLT